MNITKCFLIMISMLIVLSACGDDFAHPSADIQMTQFEGVWEADYGAQQSDVLLLKPDGTFRQIFTDSRNSYVFDSGWQKWTLEQSAKGAFLIRLQGARYYVEGNEIAESNGRKNPQNPCLDSDCTWGLEPRIFYNPFTDETVEMVDQLLLVAQVDRAGNLILHHIWTSSDRGFAIIGGNKEVFYRQKNERP